MLVNLTVLVLLRDALQLTVSSRGVWHRTSRCWRAFNPRNARFLSPLMPTASIWTQL